MFYFQTDFLSSGDPKINIFCKTKQQIFYDYILSQNVKQYNNISKNVKRN